MLTKGAIHKENITIINIYATNVGALNSIKQTPMNINGQIGVETITVVDFNTPLSYLDRSSN